MVHQEVSTLADCDALAPNLRAVDLLEIEIMGHGKTPLEALQIGVEKGSSHTIFDDDDQVIGMYGVCPSGLPGVGVPWLLCSEAFVDNKEARRRVLRESPVAIAEMHRDYPLLMNYISPLNKLTIRWLKWLGFTFQPLAYSSNILHFTRKAEPNV